MVRDQQWIPFHAISTESGIELIALRQYRERMDTIWWICLVVPAACISTPHSCQPECVRDELMAKSAKIERTL